MRIVHVDSNSNKPSKIFDGLIDENRPTGLYYILYSPNGSIVEKISDEGSLSYSSVIVNRFILLMFSKYTKEDVNKTAIETFRQLVLLSRKNNKPPESSPYIVYLINEKGLQTSFFLKMDDDDYLRFSYNYKIK